MIIGGYSRTNFFMKDNRVGAEFFKKATQEAPKQEKAEEKPTTVGETTSNIDNYETIADWAAANNKYWHKVGDTVSDKPAKKEDEPSKIPNGPTSEKDEPAKTPLPTTEKSEPTKIPSAPVTQEPAKKEDNRQAQTPEEKSTSNNSTQVRSNTKKEPPKIKRHNDLR